MNSFEICVDNVEAPTKATLVECFPDDASNAAHIPNLGSDFGKAFGNPRINVYGNPPESVINRMKDAGFWPPKFPNPFKHMPYLGGFRKVPGPQGQTQWTESPAPHWFCHVEFDVLDADLAKAYVKTQGLVEEKNGMNSFEIFVDNVEAPTRATLLECFPDDAANAAHLANLGSDFGKALGGNERISVYGNPPESVINRMKEAGCWPPKYTKPFKHMPYLGGFTKPWS